MMEFFSLSLNKVIEFTYLGRVLKKKIQTIAKRTISSTVLQVVRFE
jgi:hypothetical protein